MCFQARSDAKIENVEAYLKAAGMFRDYTDESQDPEFSEVRFAASYSFRAFRCCNQRWSLHQ